MMDISCRSIGALCAAALVAAVGTVGHAQELRGPRVQHVTIVNAGPGRVNDAYIRAQSEVREGEPLDVLALSRDIQTLMKTGYFADVKVKQEQVAGGVGLIYEVVGNYKLASEVAVEGASKVSVSRIRDRLGLKIGDYVGDEVIGVAAARVLAEYEKQRFSNARISWKIVPLDKQMGMANVELLIDEGRRSYLREVRFDGNVHVRSAVLDTMVSWPSMWNPFNWFSRKPFDAHELAQARMRVMELYLDRGFLDVQVEPADIFAGKDGGVTAVVRIREGDVYSIGDVALSGVSGDVFPQSEVWRIITSEKLDGVAGLGRIRDAARKVQEFYQGAGYPDTRVRPVTTVNPETRTVDIAFAVAEGQQVQIGTVQIRGNARTRDKVIRRELLVMPGDDYDEVRIARSERRLMNLGFFSSVRSYGIDAAPGTRDLFFEIEEKRTGQFMVGAGFSSVDNLTGFVEIQQGNFDLLGWPYLTGGGQKARLRAQFGSSRKDYRLSFTEPWFMDRQLSLSTDIYHTDLSYDNYDLERLGFSVGLGIPLQYATRLHLQYRLEREKLSDLDDINTYFYEDDPSRQYVFASEDDGIKSSLGATFLFDTRDNPLIPTRGRRVSLAGTMTGGLLGFDTDIYELDVRVAQHIALFPGHVISLRGSATVVESYGDTEEVGVSDRLYAGGPRTIRGFRFRDVGPKVFRDTGGGAVLHRAVGGKTRALASAEYTIRLAEMMRIAWFCDVGGVWQDSYDVDMDALAAGYGIGLRMDMPGFPIRLDYAWALQKDSDLTREDRWSISIGYDF